MVVAVRSVRVYPCADWVVTKVYTVTDTGMPVFLPNNSPLAYA